MHRVHPIHRTHLLIAVALVATAACSTVTQDLLKVPLLTTEVSVVDEAGQPVAGAVVQVVNGEQTTTDSDGHATVHFASLGVFTVRVSAADRGSATFAATMPLDRAKVRTIRLVKQQDININVAGLNSLGNLMGGMVQGFYPLMFQSLFAANCTSMEMSRYQPGEWTEWQLTTGDTDNKPVTMRKACLKRLANGDEWWQIRVPGDKPDETMVMEVLFSKEKRSIRRMRQRIGKGEAKEMPVTESWYTAPAKLTPESVEGSITRRSVQVTVPAGRFTADRLEFAAGVGEGSLHLWRAKGVPGEVVKSEVADADGQVGWATVLTAYGKGAATELGSY